MHRCEFAAEMRACGMPSVEMTAQYTRVREIACYGVKMRVRCDALLRGKTHLPVEKALEALVCLRFVCSVCIAKTVVERFALLKRSSVIAQAIHQCRD